MDVGEGHADADLADGVEDAEVARHRHKALRIVLPHIQKALKRYIKKKNERKVNVFGTGKGQERS